MGTNFNVGSFNAINTNETKDKKPSSSHSVNDDLKKDYLSLVELLLLVLC